MFIYWVDSVLDKHVVIWLYSFIVLLLLLLGFGLVNSFFILFYRCFLEEWRTCPFWVWVFSLKYMNIWCFCALVLEKTLANIICYPIVWVCWLFWEHWVLVILRTLCVGYFENIVQIICPVRLLGPMSTAVHPPMRPLSKVYGMVWWMVWWKVLYWFNPIIMIYVYTKRIARFPHYFQYLLVRVNLIAPICLEWRVFHK